MTIEMPSVYKGTMKIHEAFAITSPLLEHVSGYEPKVHGPMVVLRRCRDDRSDDEGKLGISLLTME
jgi:hypothetical protein